MMGSYSFKWEYILSDFNLTLFSSNVHDYGTLEESLELIYYGWIGQILIASAYALVYLLFMSRILTHRMSSWFGNHKVEKFRFDMLHQSPNIAADNTLIKFDSHILDLGLKTMCATIWLASFRFWLEENRIRILVTKMIENLIWKVWNTIRRFRHNISTLPAKIIQAISLTNDKLRVLWFYNVT